jgi:hypothetical protein
MSGARLFGAIRGVWLAGGRFWSGGIASGPSSGGRQAQFGVVLVGPQGEPALTPPAFSTASRASVW